jgi:intracellular multiplication protein IcmP
MPPAAPQQQSPDNSLGPLWIVVGLFLLGWLLWSFFHTQIVSFIFAVKGFEARIIGFVIPSAKELFTQMSQLPSDQVTFSELLDKSRAVGEYLRYPVILILVVLALYIYFAHVNLQFKKVYDMKSLVESERVNWPQITPVLKLDLVKEDIDKGPWAMALTPMQFAKKYGLLQKEKKVVTALTMSAKLRHQVTVEIRKDEAHRVFVLQLGDYWQNLEALPIATKALFAVFAARINRDRDGAQKLLLQIADSAQTGKLNFSGVDPLLKKHIKNKLIPKTVHSHAYVLTVMASMLTLARNDGVLASADFLWLKPVDRRLWLMLNSVGRQTVFSEVAGAFAHWNVERVMGRPLRSPRVDEAVNGLEAAIKDILYMEEDDEGA